MKRFLFFAIIIITNCLSLHSQGVLVSEYYNETQTGNVKPDSEWAELLVTKDGISLVGFKIRDNSSTGEWMPAFQFIDIPLWKNLHEGTIILIYLKTSPVTDDDKSDGYIQVGVEDTTYFTFLGTDLVRSLNLNQVRDMVQILDQSDNPIHTLGHAKIGDEALFNAIPVPKICYSDDLIANTGVAVLPGAKLSDYDMGFDVSKVWTTRESASAITPGLPNRNAVYSRTNINYWRELREPEWSNATFSTSDASSFDKVILTWRTVSNTANDPIEGYILLRAEGSTWPSGSLPLDSKIYAKGDMIGSAVVVDHIQNFSSDSYVDKTKLECGHSYVYALVAYRYNADGFAEDQNKKELSARGRAYNETNFATTHVITLDEPKVPAVFTIGNKREICGGDEITIFVKDTINFKGFSFQWIKDGNDMIGETKNRVIVTQTGVYSIRTANAIGCESISTGLKILVRDAPSVVLKEDKGGGQFRKFLNDTTLNLCKGDQLKLVAQISGQLDSTLWLKDGVVIQKDGAAHTVLVSGSYQVEAYAGNCPGKSAVVTVIINDIDLSITPNIINLDYDKNPVDTIKIVNHKNKALILKAADINLPAEFTIVNPASEPYLVPASDYLAVAIRFDTPDYKTVTGKFEVNAPCGNQYVVFLTGTRKKPNSTFPISELTNIDFGIIPNCTMKDTSFVIRIQGTDELIIKSDKNKDKYKGYTVEYDTGQIPNSLPWKLNEGEITVYVSFSNNVPAVYNEEILLDYTVDGVDAAEPIRVSLFGETQVPNLDVLDGFTNFRFDLFGCDNTLDTIIRVINKSPFDITIKDNFAANHIQFKILPQVIHPKETVNLNVTLMAGIYTPTTFTYEPCLVNSEEITVEISAVAPDMTFNLKNDELDFGSINNCKFPKDSLKRISFYGNAYSSSVANITVPQGIEIQGLNLGDNISTQGGQFDIKFKSDFIGILDDNIEITLTPCDIKKVIKVKGERFTPLAPLVSETILNFGDYIIGTPYVEKVLSITNNDTRDIIIKDFEGIAVPYVLLNSDIPYLLKAGETKNYTFRYERTVESKSDKLDIKIIYDSYCDFNQVIQLNGTASLGFFPANIKLSIQKGIDIGLGKKVKVPIEIHSSDTSYLGNCGIRKVKIGIQYNPQVIDILNANVGTAVLSQTHGFTFDKPYPGLSNIYFDINANHNIAEGTFVEIELLGLLGDTSRTAIEIVSPELMSDTRTINLEIENGSVTVTGICPSENRFVQVNGQQGGIISIVPNPVSDNVTLTIEVISDELTNCSIYDNLGKNIRSIVYESLKPDKYNYQLNVSDLHSGVYYIVFKNGIIVNTTKLIINK